MDGSDASSGQGKPYGKSVFKSRVHLSMIAKRKSFESMFSSACVTAQTGRNTVKYLNVKRIQLTIRLREKINYFLFIDAFFLRALLQKIPIFSIAIYYTFPIQSERLSHNWKVQQQFHHFSGILDRQDAGM